MIVIESVIKTNALGRWYIELSDTMQEDEPENRVICLDINEYVKNGIKIDKLLNIINHNTYYGAIAKIKLLRW